MANQLTDLGRGFALFARGQMMVWRRPGLLGWAVLPPLLVSGVLFGALIALSIFAEPLVTLLTPFANTWDPAITQAFRWIIAIALVLGFIYVAVRTFAIVTLAIGRPIYARIQRAVDRDCGGAGAPTLDNASVFGVGRELVQGVGESLAGGGVVFLLGLLPVVGEVAAPVTGTLMGAINVVPEVIEPAFASRGFGQLQHRKSAVKLHRAAALGFGVPAYLSMLVPLLGVALFPGVVAGGTLLARHMFGESTTPVDAR